MTGPATTRTRTGETVRYAVLAVLLGMALYPLAFMVFASTKTPGDLNVNYFLPDFSAPEWDNFATAADVVGPTIFNSIRVSLATLAIVLLVAVGAAYVFAWRRFPGKEPLYTTVIATMMVPAVLIFVPTYILVRDLGLLNNHAGLVLPFAAQTLGITVFLLRTFFRSIPRELIEAARADGASEFRVLFHIVLPLTVPMLMTVSVLNILLTWNQFLWPLVAVTDERLRTMPVGLAFLTGPYGGNLPAQMSGYVLASLPLLVLFGFTMRYFISGLTSGALKG